MLSFLSCGRKPGSGVQVDETLAQYVPPDTKALAGIDFEEIRTTPFYNRHPEILAPRRD